MGDGFDSYRESSRQISHTGQTIRKVACLVQAGNEAGHIISETDIMTNSLSWQHNFWSPVIHQGVIWPQLLAKSSVLKRMRLCTGLGAGTPV